MARKNTLSKNHTTHHYDVSIILKKQNYHSMITYPFRYRPTYRLCPKPSHIRKSSMQSNCESSIIYIIVLPLTFNVDSKWACSLITSLIKRLTSYFCLTNFKLASTLYATGNSGSSLGVISSYWGHPSHPSSRLIEISFNGLICWACYRRSFRICREFQLQGLLRHQNLSLCLEEQC